MFQRPCFTSCTVWVNKIPPPSPKIFWHFSQTAMNFYSKLYTPIIRLRWTAKFDSAPSIGVYYFLSLTLSVCLSVCLFVTLLRSFKSILLLCFSMESSHFLAISSPWQKLQNVVLRILICCHGNEIWAIFAKNFKLLLLFCFPMESSHFLVVSSPWSPLQNVVLRFLI